MWSDIAAVVMIALVICAIGIAIQSVAHPVLTRHLGTDGRELVNVLGFRIAAVFSIVVGLIVNSTYGDYTEARRDLLEEARALGTAYVLAGRLGPETGAGLQAQIMSYIDRISAEIGDRIPDPAKVGDGDIKLLKLCSLPAIRTEEGGTWVEAELGRACSKLVELRGKRLVLALEQKKETWPLWCFLIWSLAALAVLLGAYEFRPVTIALCALFYFGAGLTFALIYGMSEPFDGPTAIDEATFVKLTDSLAKRSPH